MARFVTLPRMGTSFGPHTTARQTSVRPWRCCEKRSSSSTCPHPPCATTSRLRPPSTRFSARLCSWDTGLPSTRSFVKSSSAPARWGRRRSRWPTTRFPRPSSVAARSMWRQRDTLLRLKAPPYSSSRARACRWACRCRAPSRSRPTRRRTCFPTLTASGSTVSRRWHGTGTARSTAATSLPSWDTSVRAPPPVTRPCARRTTQLSAS